MRIWLKMAKDLDEMGMNLQEAGFRVDEVEKLIGDKIEKEEQDKDGEVESLSQPGDIWELGKHRVLCGDSSDANRCRYA